MTISKSRKLFYTFVILFLLIIAPTSSAQAPIFDRDLLNLGVTKPGYIRAYNQIKLPEAWQYLDRINPPLSSVRIGIIDSGIDAEHPEFQDVDLNGTSAKAKVDRYPSGSGHGTQVAGIIGANNISFPDPTNYIFPQMNGILSGVRNLDYSLAVDYDGGPNIFRVIFDIYDLALRKNTGIINMSFNFFPEGGQGCVGYQFICNSIFRPQFLTVPNTLFIVSAGDIRSDFSDVECFCPAGLGNNLSNVITVGGLDSSGEERYGTSPFGDAVNIAASAENVYTPQPQNRYDHYFSGTSAAAPMVTGVAGILKAIKPELTASEIKNILVQTADPVSTDEPIGGRLNALKAVEYLLPPTEWSLPEILDTAPPELEFAQFAVTSDNLGNLHLLWGNLAEIHYSKRDETGWSESIVILEEGWGVDIASDNLNHLHVISMGRGDTTTADVFYMMWDGAGWSEPLNITHGVVSYAGASKIAVDNNNNPHVVWEGEGPWPKVFYIKETNGSWSEPVVISPPPADAYCGSSGLLIVADNNDNLHVIMNTCLSLYPITTTLFYTKWDGSEWSEPINLNISGEGDYKLAVDRFNHPHVLVGDRISGKHGMYHIYWNGSNWTSSVDISGTGNFVDGVYVTVDDLGIIHTIWREQLKEALPEFEYQILYSSYDGTSWSEPEIIPNIPVKCYPMGIAADIFNHVHVIYQYSQDTMNYLSHIWR